MQITVNGDKQECSESLTIDDLIKSLHLASDRLAVERNREVVTRSDWSNITLEDNDQIEIIHFVGGGI